MIQFILACFFLTCSLAADRKNEHICMYQFSEILENHLECHWKNIQEVSRHPNMRKAIAIMLEMKADIECLTGKKLDSEKYLKAVFSEMYLHKLGMSAKNESLMTSILTRGLKKNYKRLKIPIKTQIGITISLCGMYITSLPDSRNKIYNAEAMICLGLDLIRDGYDL